MLKTGSTHLDGILHRQLGADKLAVCLFVFLNAVILLGLCAFKNSGRAILADTRGGAQPFQYEECDRSRDAHRQKPFLRSARAWSRPR